MAWRISRGIDAIGDEGWANTGPQVIVDLAAQLGISSEERDLDVYDAVTADEVFLTSTSLCICGVRSLNGARIADGAAPGPITRRLTEAYVKSVGCDFVQ